MMKDDVENLVARAESNLQRQLEWIGKYDSRIIFIAGISIAMLGVISSTFPFYDANLYLYILFLITLLLLLGSLICIYFGQYPKTNSLNSSLIFFGDIAKMKHEKFKETFKGINKEEYLDDLLSQIYINAKILEKKFILLKISLILLLVSVIPWMLIIYLIKLYDLG